MRRCTIWSASVPSSRPTRHSIRTVRRPFHKAIRLLVDRRVGCGEEDAIETLKKLGFVGRAMHLQRRPVHVADADHPCRDRDQPGVGGQMGRKIHHASRSQTVEPLRDGRQVFLPDGDRRGFEEVEVARTRSPERSARHRSDRSRPETSRRDGTGVRSRNSTCPIVLTHSRRPVSVTNGTTRFHPSPVARARSIAARMAGRASGA